MKCTSCNNENSNNARFCTSCGRPLAVVLDGKGSTQPPLEESSLLSDLLGSRSLPNDPLVSVDGNNTITDTEGFTKEAEISSMPVQIDRYLTASLLLDSSFRQKLIDLIKEKRRALAPELGIDLTKLIRLSYLLDAREKKYQKIFALITIVTAVVMIVPIGSSLKYFILLLYLLVVGAIYFYKSFDQKYNLVPLIKYKAYYDSARLEQVLEGRYKSETLSRPIPDLGQNLVVYQGFVPFVGSGLDLGGWSFPINITRPREEMGQFSQIKSFNLPELYTYIDQALRKCDFGGFTTRDFLFVNGKQVRDIEWILPDITRPPVFRVSETIIREYLINNNPLVRYYKWMRIIDWNNELILSYFLRFSIRGEYLFIEANRFLLTPLDKKYREIDNIQEALEFGEQVSEFIGLIIASLLVAPFVSIASIFTLINQFISSIGKLDSENMDHSKQAAKARKDILFDYGAETSLRSQISSREYGHYFQKLDKEMYIKVFEKQLLESLTNFLIEHGIDTSDIQDRQSAILNTGIIMQGGELNAESLAVGSGAAASVMQQAGQQIKKLSGTETKPS